MLALVTTGAATIGPEVYGLAAAALVLAVGALAIAAMLLKQRGWLPASTVDFATWSAVLAAGFSFGAAAIHFAIIGEHFVEYPPYGIAFAVLAWFQALWGVLYVARRRGGLAALAILVNGGTLVVWAISRTVGLPIGPAPGELEPIGPLDQLAGVLEIALIAVLAWDLAASRRQRPGLSATSAVVYVGSAILAVVVLTSTAFAATGGSSHSSGSADAGPVASGDAAAGGHVHVSVGGSPSPVAPTSPEASTPARGAIGASPSPPEASLSPSVASPGPQRPGTIAFGSTFDLSGAIQGPTARFRPGQTTVWLADLSAPPDAPTVRFIIVQILPDGREFEHWRQDMPTIDPGGRLLVGMADLSIYVHGGAGSYRMRYFRGDQLLAEGAFELIP